MTGRNGHVPEKMLLSPTSPSETNSLGFKGLSLLTTVWFLVGTACGAGIMGLPHALVSTGWVGVFIMVMIGVASLYTGHLLGRCVAMVRERYSDQADLLRYPYPAVGQITYGPPLRVLISVLIDITALGESIVYLLLAAENLSGFLLNFRVNLTPCCLTVVIAVTLCPVCWFGTPKDFWPLAFAASSTMLVAAVILQFAILKDAEEHSSPDRHQNFQWDKMLIAFGTFFYAYGVHPNSPTYQIDMKQPSKFTLAISIAFAIASMVYIIVAIEGYLVYGSSLKDNLLLTVTSGPLLSTIQVLLILHLLCTFVMALNPVNQEGEEILNIPPKFCLRRVLLRTGVVCLVLFVCLTVPKFGIIMAFLGGSTVAPLMFIIPCLCYLKLCSMAGPLEPIEVPLHEKVACVELMIVGAMLGLGATAASLDVLTGSEFSKPCYLS